MTKTKKYFFFNAKKIPLYATGQTIRFYNPVCMKQPKNKREVLSGTIVAIINPEKGRYKVLVHEDSVHNNYQAGYYAFLNHQEIIGICK